MIRVAFSCAQCAWSRVGATTGPMLEAQDHANQTGHVIRVSGQVDDRVMVVKSPEPADLSAQAALRRARESAILRLARDKGLLKKMGR